MAITGQDLADALPTIVVAAAFVCFFMIIFLLRRRRRQQIYRFAADQNLRYDRYELPRDFPIKMLDTFGDWGRAHNVIYGTVDGDRLVAFDIVHRFGRRSFRSTIVARRSNRVGEVVLRRRDLLLWRQGSWTALTREHTVGNGLMEPEFILEMWLLLGRVDRAL